MSPLPGETQRDFAPDAAARADYRDDLTRQLLFRRHALELGFFQQPVFDIESFLLGQGDITPDRLRAAHDLHRAAIKLRRDARLALIFAPGNEAQARNQKYRGIRIADDR